MSHVSVPKRLLDGEVCEYSGPLPGHTVLFIGGTHGNEHTGIEVVVQLYDALESGRLKATQGMIRLALGNPRAVSAGTRLSDEKRDLNKSFTKNILEDTQDDSYEAVRARELRDYIATSDIVIDIHSTQRPTARPFISAKIDPAHEDVYRWFNPPIQTALQDPLYVFAGEMASIDEYADTCGAVGICLESGYAEASNTDMVMQGINNLLISKNLIEGNLDDVIRPPMDCFEWVESLPFDPEAGWEWSPDVSVKSFEFIPAGKIIGYAGTKAISRPFDSYLLFPKTDELRALEGRVTYLAKRI